MSNRLTFSLASLIFLIAFGLVFGPTAVLAHDGTAGNLNHSHPLLVALPARDVDGDDTPGEESVPGEAAVTPHGAHPMVTSVVALPGANSAVGDKAFSDRHVLLLSTAGSDGIIIVLSPIPTSAPADGTFKVRVTFDGTLPTTGDGSDIGDGEMVIIGRYQTTGLAATVTATAAKAMTTGESPTAIPNKYDLTFTVGSGQYWVEDADPNTTGNQPGLKLPIEVFIKINENALMSVATVHTDGTNLNAAGNSAYASGEAEKFTVVSGFDTTGPTVTLAADPTKFNAAGKAVFKADFNEALKSSDAGALAVGDFTIANGTGVLSNLTNGAPTLVPDSSPKKYRAILTVTPTNANEGVKVTLKADSVEDVHGNDGPSAAASAMVTENIKPAVTVAVDQVVKPTPADPTKNTKAKFSLTFTEELSASHFNKLDLINDLTIVGGTAAAADLTGPTAITTNTNDLQDDQKYVLTVTPNASLEDGDPVSVTVNNQIQDAATPPNNLDLERGTRSASFNIDLLPPTVTITAPEEPLATGKLEFKFLFSEPIDATTFKAADITGEDYVVTDRPAKAPAAMQPAGKSELWTAKVKPTGDDDVTIVLNVDSVADMVGRTLAEGASAIYRGPNTDPFFPANAAVANLPAGLCVDNSLPAGVVLPLANDTEGDTLTYSLTVGTPAVTVPNAMRAAGFYWETTDTQTRVLKGKATMADSGTYTWKVTDSHGAMDTMTFSITVKAHQLPEKVTGLAAAKVDAASMLSPTKNRVRLTWAAPMDKSAYPDCIPAVTGYTVTRMTFDRLAGTFGNAMTHVVPDASAMSRSYDVPELPTGIYQFTIVATNSVGDSPAASDAAVWDVTGGMRVVVADPPASPTDLDATINTNSVTLDWLKVPDTADGGAPIHDDMDATNAKLTKVRSDFYGPGVTGDYAGYVVYQTNEDTAEVTRYPETGTLMNIGGDSTTAFNYTHPAYQIANLAPAEYTFRIVAKNIAGESPDSETARKRVVIVPAAPNNAPTFAAGATISNIVATVGVAIPGSILPVATDADSGDTLTYSIEPDLPPGLTFDDDTRALTGTPSEATEQKTYTYAVEDNRKGKDTITFLITVNAAPDPTNAAPDFGDATIANITATVGQAITGRILPEATDKDSNDTLTYSITPDVSLIGLSFDATTRALTGTPSKKAAETVYTYKVMDRASGGKYDTISFFITVNSATAGPGIGTPTAMLPAKGYIVYVRSLANAPVFGTANPMVAEWAAMPNLYELFRTGGGGSLQLNVTGVNARQVVMTEVMWAVDEGKVGQNSYTGQQWIELYNGTDAAINISNISFVAKNGRPALAQGTDLISNVVGAGNDWIKAGKGQNGNSAAGSLKEFISMYRNNRGKEGWNAGHWSQSTLVYHPNHKGTPGKGEPQGPVVIGTTSVARGPVIFNEISNNSNAAHEWIELKNVSGGNVNLKNYEVTMITAVDSDVDLIDFTGADRNVPAGEVVLVVKSDPTGDPNHPLAAGWNFGARGTWNVAKPGEAHYVPGVNANSPRYIVASKFEAIPDNGEFVLVLRNRQDRNKSTGDNNIRDIAGYVPGTRLKVETATAFTHLWPLSNYPAPNLSNNSLKSGEVHRRQHANIDGTRTHDGNKVDKTAFRDVGWTSVGYKRNAAPNAQNGGTPGYANNVLRSNDADANKAVIISEIMPTTGARNLPEWIELRNLSKSIGINVDNWRVTITNHDSDGAGGTYDGDLNRTITLSGRIPPGQTYLIVARNGRNTTKLPSARIKNVGRTRAQTLINPYGFEIKLESKKDNNYLHVDTVGNLGAAEGRRSRSFAPIMWEWPASTDDAGNRISIVRVPMKNNGWIDGTAKGAWKSFDDSVQFDVTDEDTYYGHSNDIGSPGHSAGGVLPVELSTFRPQRLDDGTIVIRWTTESELDNAGFNILRSESRDGEFKQLNKQLIAGQGTTSERTAYEFTDKSAKPNVVYYYQIQDVSLDGDIATLKTTHVRGHVSATGKLTTTWGELKSLQ